MRKLVLAIVSCLLYQQIVAKVTPLSEGVANTQYSVSACVLSVSEEFHTEDVVTVALTTLDYKNYSTSVVVLDQLLLRGLHDQMKWTLLITKSNRPEEESQFFKKSDEYIIQIRDNDEFDSILRSLLEKSSWNPYGKFIIVTTTIFPNPGDIVQYIFERFWEEKVLNVIILLPQLEDPSVLNVYSWFPFQNGNCGNQFSVAQVVNKCRTGKMANTDVLFPSKVPLDMNGCVVKVRAIIWPPYIVAPEDFNYTHCNTAVNFTKGIEILLVNTIAEVANLTVLYSVSQVKQDWGKLLPNGTATGLMKTLMMEEADIGIGALAPLDRRHYLFDASESYARESVTWCIPHAPAVPRWKCLLRIFHPLAWSVIIVTNIVLTLSVWIVSRKDTVEFPIYQSPQGCFLNVFSILLGIPVHTMPKIIKTRLLMFLWIVVSLHLNSAYTSSLIRELTQPSFEKATNNIDDLIAQGFKIGLVSPTQRFLRYDHKMKYMESIVEMCPDVIPCLDRTAYARDFAVGLPRMYMQFASNKYITAKGQAMVHWMKDDIASYPVEMLMTKGFPLLKRINALIFRIKESGLISKWHDDFLDQVNKNLPAQWSDDNDIILTKSHLEGAFIFLLLGHSFAAVVLILEMFLYQRKIYCKH